MEKPTAPRNIAEDFYIGRTHIRICTDCCCKREEVPVILERIAGHALEAFAAADRK
jgi:hypothetical protein